MSLAPEHADDAVGSDRYATASKDGFVRINGDVWYHAALQAFTGGKLEGRGPSRRALAHVFVHGPDGQAVQLVSRHDPTRPYGSLDGAREQAIPPGGAVAARRALAAELPKVDVAAEQARLVTASPAEEARVDLGIRLAAPAAERDGEGETVQQEQRRLLALFREDRKRRSDAA